MKFFPISILRQWPFRIQPRYAMGFVAMNATLAIYELQKYYLCQEQPITAFDRMQMAVGLMDQRGLMCPTQNDAQMMIIENLIKTGAVLAVDAVVAGVKKVIQKIREKEDVFYDALETDENRIPFIYDCIDKEIMPNYSVNHLYTVLREARMDFSHVRFILAQLYAVAMKHGKKEWALELRDRALRFFRGYPFSMFFPLDGIGFKCKQKGF